MNPWLFQVRIPRTVRIEKGRYEFILRRCRGKKVKTSPDDDAAGPIAYVVLNIIAFPFRFLLYKLNPFLGDGLIFVVHPN